LKEAVKGDDKETIEAKTHALTELSGKLAERVYAQTSGEGPSGSASAGAGDTAGGSESAGGDDVVDAEFEEVKDDKK